MPVFDFRPPETREQTLARIDAKLLALRERTRTRIPAATATAGPTASGTAPGSPPVPLPAYVGPMDPDPGAHERQMALDALPYAARMVVMLAPDLDVPVRAIVIAALWAPKVAEDMVRRGGDVAFLSRETLTAATGIDGARAMIPGGVVEDDGGIGLVRLVKRGSPGAVRLKEGWRGEASTWTVTCDPTRFRHTPKRTGHARKARVVGPDMIGMVESLTMGAWLNPGFAWWHRDAAGLTGLRLIATLISRFGLADVSIGYADAGRLVGRSRRLMVGLMARLADLGIAERDGTRWRILLGSRLSVLAAAEVIPGPPRPEPVSRERAATHDWTWFTVEGRSVRAEARHTREKLRDGRLDAPPGSREAEWVSMPRGMLRAIVYSVRAWREDRARYTKAAMQAAHEARTAPPATSVAVEPAPALRELTTGSQDLLRAFGARTAGMTAAEKIALLRRPAPPRIPAPKT